MRPRIVFAGGDSAHTRVSRDVFLNPTPSIKVRKMSKNDECRDEWIWKDETTLVRAHNIPRRKMFVPKEADFLPCRLKRFRDARETYQLFQSSGRIINDSWRLAGNNIERTNKRSFGQGLRPSRSFPMPMLTICWIADLTWRTGHRARIL